MKYINYYLLSLLLLVGCYHVEVRVVRIKDQVCASDSLDGSIQELQKKANEAFDKAEKEVLKPLPKPDDLVGPHPDPAKCICKGTGIIVHGDGHKTPCEYHGKAKPQVSGTTRVSK